MQLEKDVAELISQVGQYSEWALGFSIKGFEEFKEAGGNYYWVYAAHKDKLASLFPSHQPFVFFEDKKKTKKARKKLKKEGYDVLFFEGEAQGDNSQITKGFLKAELSRKVELLIHESVHHFLAGKSYSNFLPYELEECLATYIGVHGAEEFCSIYYPKHQKKARKMVKYRADFAKVVNMYWDVLTVCYQHDFDRDELMKSFKKDLETLGNVVKKEDMNNAFLIRSRPYTVHYPLVEHYFSQQGRTIKGLMGTCPKRQREKLEALVSETLAPKTS